MSTTLLKNPSTSSADVAHQVIGVARELTALLVLEQKMILGQNVAGTLDFAARKQVLIDAYQSGLAALEQDTETLAQLDRDVKVDLKATLGLLQKTMQATLDTVEAARNARIFILESIREAMITDQKSPTYAARLPRHGAANYGNAASVSVSFNETL
jgi:hypothetical protein